MALEDDLVSEEALSRELENSARREAEREILNNVATGLTNNEPYRQDYLNKVIGDSSIGFETGLEPPPLIHL